MWQNLKEENEKLKAYIKRMEEKVNALKDTYYDSGVGADELKDLLILVRDEDFVIENFPEFEEVPSIYDEEEEEEEEEEEPKVEIKVPPTLCWTCDERIATYREWRDGLGEYEFTCPECHRNEYTTDEESDDDEEVPYKQNMANNIPNYDEIVKDLKNLFGENCIVREDSSINSYVFREYLSREDWDNVICVIDCDEDNKYLDYFTLYEGSDKLIELYKKYDYNVSHDWQTECLAYVYYDEVEFVDTDDEL